MKTLVNRLLLSLVLVLPWHSLIINGYLKNYFPPLILWKEFFIVILFLLALLYKGIYSKKIESVFIFYTIAVLTLFLCFNSLGVDSLSSYRIYVLPLLLSFSIFKLDKLIDWGQILRAFVYTAILMAMFSIIQQLFLGESIYLNAGYPTNSFSDEKLNFAFYVGFGLLQRGAGGFSAPIPYSFYLILALVLSSQFASYFKAQNYIRVGRVILLISLILTFSRASIAVYVLVFILPQIKIFKLKSLTFFIVFIGVVVGQYFAVSDHIKSMELSTLVTFYNNVTSLNDASSEGHFDSLNNGFMLASENIGYGLGLGSVGPHTASYLKTPIVIESSYLSSIIELGLFTAALIYCTTFFIHYKKGSRSTLIILCYLAVSFLLPLIYYVELTVLLIIALQILNNKEKYVNNSRESVASNNR